VLLRVLPLLVLSVFVDLDSEVCEPIGDLKASVISIRHSRSFNDAVKVANFFSNEGSDWVCASVC
jgi:ACT domain-containing protein